MMHRFMEELFDSLFYIGTVMGLLLFFLCYWSGNYQKRCAELVAREFLTEVSAKGSISAEDYEKLLINLNQISSSIEAEVECSSYGLQPIYAKISGEKLTQYYLSGNTKQKVSFSEVLPEINEEDRKLLRLQKETNASILAAENKEYIQLPEEGQELLVKPVREVQEVYEGEDLITLCYVSSESGNYYMEAEACCAEQTGTVNLRLCLNGKEIELPVQVICHTRVVYCENGHEIVNTEELIESSQSGRELSCPFCAWYPKKITCNVAALNKKTGTGLSKDEVWLQVVFLNGTTKVITTDSNEWQDDYDAAYCGIQAVTIRYRNVETMLTVISENPPCRECGKACNERSYEDYTAFPYCVSCMSEAALFTGNTVEEKTIISMEEIQEQLGRKQDIRLEYGDSVSVTLWYNKKYSSFLHKTVKRKTDK